AYNRRERLNNPMAHAEMLAITQAAAAMSSWRLDGAVLYVTLEPCAMCAGAIIQARIPLVVYGANDPKAGAAGSVVDLFRAGLFNHDVEVFGGVLAEEAGTLLSEFFRALRSAGRDEASDSR
ncbi:MAG TPA: nucleoside deaminase, partial [Planctomycetes bacterium]|nr:nucleoside deaminase [Planctomycetota bacterium]